MINMHIISLDFLTAVALGVGAYWACPRGWRLSLAGLCGFALLAWAAPWSAVGCLLLTLASYALSQRIASLRTAYALAALIFLSLVLMRHLAAPLAAISPVLPWLGAAFYTLRALHYLLGAVQKQLPPHSLPDYLRYMFFPPALLIGPLQRFEDFEREARRCRFDPQYLSAGLERLLFAYAKIVLLANYAVGIVFASWIATLDPGLWRLYLECLKYGLDLYFKFAGYSDIAIGIALLIGIRLPENFKHPFFAVNISDFWKRWHISVSSWCRDHVNYPLYARTRSPALAALAAMLVLGLWHESSWRYLAWGAYHGAGILSWQYWRSLVKNSTWSVPTHVQVWLTGLSRLVTFNFVVLSFLITSSADLPALLDRLN